MGSFLGAAYLVIQAVLLHQLRKQDNQLPDLNESCLCFN
jgi:hypothetical protein